MTLRRKLLVAFGGLAALAVLAALVTVYITVRWQATTAQAQAHYQRSLLLQGVRAQTFQALAEVNDALAGEPADRADAQADFERAIAGTEESFAQWRTLSEDLRETVEILEVQSSYENLTTYARQVFALLEANELAEAVRLVDDELDTGDYARFQEATERAVAADERSRQVIVALSQELRRTALVMAAVMTIAALSLSLLIAAYLAQDLFQPLSALRGSLDGLADGDGSRRMPVDRADEFGRVAAAFNRAAEAQERRAAEHAATEGADGGGGDGNGSLRGLLQGAAARLRAELEGLRGPVSDERTAAADRVRGELLDLSEALSLGFPAARPRVPLDPRHSAQDALAAIGPLLAERGVSCECELEPEAGSIAADPAQLREILTATLRQALAALPAQGGRIGLRVRRATETGRLHIDVATSGEGAAGGAREDAEGDALQHRVRRRIVRELGGEVETASGADGARVTRLTFPLTA